MNQNLQPSLESAMIRFYGSQEPEAAFAAHLEERLRKYYSERISSRRHDRASRSDRKKLFMQTLQAHPARALCFAILSLLVITGIVYALGRLTGFIPGFGFTSQGETVYTLAEPVESSMDGITLRVQGAISGEERFWVELTVEGDDLSTWESFSSALVQQESHEALKLQSSSSSQITENEIEMNFDFPALGNQPQEVTLMIEDLYGQDFTLPLKLSPIEEGEVVPIPVEASILQKSESHQGVQMVMDAIAVNSEKTIFQVSIHYNQPNTWVMSHWNVILSDEKGNLYPLTDITPATMNSGDTHIYKTIPFEGTEKLVLTLATFPPSDTLNLFTDFSEDSPNFSFHVGEDPEIGQIWKLDQELAAGDFHIKIINATLADETKLLFEIESDPPVNGVMFSSSDPLVDGPAGGLQGQNGSISAGLTFSRIPEQALEIRLIRVYYQVKGTWQIHWQPQAAPPQDRTTPTKTAVPTMLPLPSATPITGNPLLLEVKQLADKFDAPFQQGAGWVHVVQETNSEPRIGQTYPPAYYRSEQWYEVDEEGYVNRTVGLDYNSEGQIIQQSATVGDYSVNFTTGDSGSNNGLRYRFSLDRMTQILSSAEESGTKVLHENGKCEDGRACLILTMKNEFDQSVQNPGEAQAFAGIGQRVWIDLETGQQRKHQTFWLLEDGSESIISTINTLLVEKVSSPPQNILAILEKAIPVP